MSSSISIAAYVSNANPTDLEKQRAQTGYAYLREKLSRAFPEWRFRLSGSYGRDTSCAPLNDVDVFMIISPTANVPPDSVVAKYWEARDRVVSFLRRLDFSFKVREQDRSVGVTLFFKDNDNNSSEGRLDFDIVMAMSSTTLPSDLKDWDGLFVIIDRETSEPVTTNPLLIATASTKANERWNGHLKPFIRLIKQLNARAEKPLPGQSNDTQKPFKSIHLEVMCYSAPAPRNLRARDSDAALEDFVHVLWHILTTFKDGAEVKAPGSEAKLDSYFDEQKRTNGPYSREKALNWIQSVWYQSYQCLQGHGDLRDMFAPPRVARLKREL